MIYNNAQKNVFRGELRKKKVNKGFTLSEVLIALVIIGVVAAITVPTIYTQNKWKQYKAGAFKAIAALNQSAIAWHSKNGTLVECGYWLKNPYSGDSCTAECSGYNEAGSCTGYRCKETGNALPADYNGYFGDCRALYDFYKKNMNVVKVCDSNAYSNGCIPEYEGIDTAYMANNESATEYAANKATSGCGGFKKQSILNGMAFITGDGMIYFPYSTSGARIMAVDVNGFKGPNKWGHDVHSFVPKLMNPDVDPVYVGGGCSFYEKGGISVDKLLYKK